MSTRGLLFALTIVVAVTMVYSFEMISSETVSMYSQVAESKCQERCESPQYCYTLKNCKVTKYDTGTATDCGPSGEEPEGTEYVCLAWDDMTTTTTTTATTTSVIEPTDPTKTDPISAIEPTQPVGDTK